MITPNIAARDYRWRLDASATRSGNYQYVKGFSGYRGDELQSKLRVNVGYTGELDPMIDLSLTQISDINHSLGGVVYIRLVTAWGVFDTGYVGGWRDTVELLVELDNVALVTSCYELAEVTADELRFYVDGELVYTISGPLTYTVFSWHPIWNYTYVDSRIKAYTDAEFENGWLSVPSNCGPGTSSGITYNRTVIYTLTTTGGWQYFSGGVWTSDSTSLFSHSLPGIGSCSCIKSLPTISAGNSWSLIVRSDFDHLNNHTYTSATNYSSSKLLTFRRSTIYGVASNLAEMDTSTKQEKQGCNAIHSFPIPAIQTLTGPDGIAYCRDYTLVEHREAAISCINFVGTPTFCNYIAETSLQWIAPNCEDPPVATPSDPDVLHDFRTNEYYFARVIDGDIWVRHSNHENFVLGFNSDVQVTSSGNCASPCLGIGTHGVIYLVYHTSTPNTYIVFSTDQGKTWSSATLLFSNGKYPRIATAPNGTQIAMCFKHDSGSSGWGRLYISQKDLGDTAWSTEAVALDETGSQIQTEDDRFAISFAFDAHGRFSLVAKRRSETDLTHFMSADYGLTWTEL